MKQKKFTETQIVAALKQQEVTSLKYFYFRSKQYKITPKEMIYVINNLSNRLFEESIFLFNSSFTLLSSSSIF
ncbi:hypothetical protein SAMN05660909_05420 [Chitinophaga terrae (ex Kim and Jung 2007)]|uniref:Uncharacterized protein n=1 Tax=Chitinophaga terrae (ex Kim and Jung 2007) TaxID=408074 RepID=A0A1H4GJ57_9BACT|nr:hypothetical protein SAMN05660909_05420 [Chitinophaga terrae (ex Kim and Jung 2007)]